MNTEQEEKKSPGRTRTITDAVLARAMEKYESGWSVPKIARQPWCNVGPATLYYHLRGDSPVGDGAVEMRPKGRPGLSNEQLSLVLELYAEGQTLTKIRKHKDLSWRALDAKSGKRVTKHFSLPTLSKALKEAGVEVRRGRPPKPEAE